MEIKTIAKAVVAVCGVVIVAANGLADDGSLSLDEIVAIVTAAGVAAGVYSVPNKKAARHSTATVEGGTSHMRTGD